MSGHNRWSSIKHKKGAADAKRGKIFTKVIKEITVAARMGGGDPSGNPRLRHAIDEAKAVNMPGDNVTRAIKKGTGELEGVSYEEITYEGVGTSGTLFLIDTLTDNRNRTNPELKKIFERHNGQLGTSGSAAWAFDAKGLLYVPKEAAEEEQLFEIAVGAGAENVEDVGDRWMITTERSALEAVRQAVTAAGINGATGHLSKLPKNKKIVEGREAEVLMNLVEALEDHDDVQKVYSDFELSEAELQRLSQ
ncbi:MAG TPA: YebC/PmpR family DNA-binding transcriptional regulator [Polyangiaceae bacterium]|nr:YebC/PmpR family DNA-binding transcriptional regulator [Polyangiaceae bacterium]